MPKKKISVRQTIAIILVIVGVLFITLGTYSAWLRTQLLDTDVWVATSRETLRTAEVRTAVAGWAVDELFSRTDPESAFESWLPKQAQPLAGPLTSRLRQESYGIAERALTDERVEAAWVVSNRRAHRRFLRLIAGNDPLVVDGPNGIKLDVRPLVEELASRIGVQSSALDRIPADATVIQPKNSESLERGLRAIRLLYRWGYAIGALGVISLLIGITLTNNRRRTWMWSGAAIALSAWIIGRSQDLLGPFLARAVTSVTTWQYAVSATWKTMAAPLRDISTSGILIGAVIVIFALVTGPSAPMIAARRKCSLLLVDQRPAAVVISAAISLILLRNIPAFTSLNWLVDLMLMTGCMFAVWTLGSIAKKERLDQAGIKDEDSKA